MNDQTNARPILAGSLAAPQQINAGDLPSGVSPEPERRPAAVDEVEGIADMPHTSRILAMIERAQLHVNAFDSLAAGLAAGLKEDSIDPAHVYTLVTTLAASVREQLTSMEAVVNATR